MNCVVKKLNTVVNGDLEKIVIPTEETIAEVAVYSAPGENAAYYLQKFYNNIGTSIKAKLIHMMMPAFSSNVNECFIDILTGSSKVSLPVDKSNNENYYYFNNSTKYLKTTLGAEDNGLTEHTRFAFSKTESSKAGYSQFLAAKIPSGTNKYEINIANVPVQFEKTYCSNTDYGVLRTIGYGFIDNNDSAKTVTLLESANGNGSKLENSDAWYSAISSNYLSGRPFGTRCIDDSFTGYDGTRIVVTAKGLTEDEFNLLGKAVYQLDIDLFG